MDVTPLWNFADPAASEAAFRDALMRATNADDSLVLETQIARTMGLRRRFAEAHAWLDRVEPRLASAGAEPRVRYLLERGRTFRSAKEAAQARPLFESAVAQAAAARLDALEIDAMHMVALVEPATDAQLDWNRRALAKALASADPVAQRWQASLASNIGWTLADAGRHAEALASFEQALQARIRFGGKPADIVAARWMVARTLRSLGRHADALAILEALEREGAAAGQPDGHVHAEIGENLLATGKADAARPWFATAWRLLAADTSPDRAGDDALARLDRLSRAP